MTVSTNGTVYLFRGSGLLVEPVLAERLLRFLNTLLAAGHLKQALYTANGTVGQGQFGPTGEIGAALAEAGSPE